MTIKLQDVHSILIIRSGALGDLIYATAIIDALILEFGQDLEIDMIINPNVADVLKNDPRLHTLYPLKYRKVPFYLSPEKLKVFFHSLKTPYHLLINLEENSHFDALAKKIVAKKKLGAPFTKTQLLPNQQHMVEIIKQMAAPVCKQQNLDAAVPTLYGTPWAEVCSTYELPEEYIVLNPSNSHANRNKINYRAWPQGHWKSLISMIPSHIPLVLIAGKGEEDYFKEIQPYPDNIIDLTGRTPLPDLIGVIEHAQAIVTTDTGPAHLAAAVNTEIYVLIGPTYANLTGPYPTAQNRVHFISMELDCSPCYNTEVMHACTDNICMKQITPERVHSSLQTTLQKFKTPSKG